jgi:ribosomal protein S18 acetylase RimI-like enzyme
VPWTIAPITLEDADEVGRVHVRVWQEAYAGLMPEDYLDGLDPVAFAAGWRERLGHPTAGVGHWLARDERGVLGITTSGPARDDDAPVRFELYAINVLARGHGSGVARDLLGHALGDAAAYLWVLEGNQRAQAFYRRHGFADDGGRKQEPDTGTLEVRMSRHAVTR